MKRVWFNVFMVLAGLVLIVLLFFAIQKGPTGYVVADTSSPHIDLSSLSDENGSQNFTLYEGDSTVISSGNMNYTIKLSKISNNKATISINGIINYPLTYGESISAEGFKIVVLNISSELPKPFMEVSISKASNSSSKPVSVSSGISSFIKGGVPSGVSITCSSGCLSGNECVQYGERQGKRYCASGGNMTDQISGGIACQNNFECSSNVCNEGRCTSPGIFQRISDWFKSLVGIQ